MYVPILILVVIGFISCPHTTDDINIVVEFTFRHEVQFR
jgi:hypothetical protein